MGQGKKNVFNSHNNPRSSMNYQHHFTDEVNTETEKKYISHDLRTCKLQRHYLNSENLSLQT